MPATPALSAALAEFLAKGGTVKVLAPATPAVLKAVERATRKALKRGEGGADLDLIRALQEGFTPDDPNADPCREGWYDPEE